MREETGLPPSSPQQADIDKTPQKAAVCQDFLAKCRNVLNFFQGARLVRLRGYSNGNKDYKEAKHPIDTGWQNKTNYAPDDPQSLEHLARGGWVGLLIPDGVIVVDIDDMNISKEIADALRRACIPHISIETPHGGQFFFRDEGLVKTQGAQMLCLLGISIDYRLQKKGQVVLPTEGTACRHIAYMPTSGNGKPPELATMPLFFLLVRKVKKGEDVKDVMLSVSEGGRNDHLNAAIARMIGYNDAHKLKLSKNTVLQAALEFNAVFCIPPLPDREASTTFESAWRSLAGKSKATAQRTETIVSDTTPFDATTLPFCFWSEERKNETPKLKVDVELLMRFLEKEGYRKAIVTKGELQKILVYVEDNLIEEVSLSEIKNRLLSQEHEPYNYLFRLPDKISSNFNKIDLRKRLLDVINAYIEPGKLDALPVIENLNTLRDSKTVSFFFFRNGFVEVTKNGIELRDYKDLPGLIWKSQRKEHDYVVTSDGIDDFSFFRFLQNVCTQRDALSHENNRFEEQRFKSLQTVIGHLMSNAYDPAYQKAIILSDSALTPNPEGGTGKGIMCNSVNQLRKTTRVDGQSINFKSQFALQELEIDTQIVWFDDVKANFDFGSLFSFITEHYAFEKKHQQKVKFRPDNNPKTVICTNYAVKGLGASHERRKFEFELLNYYGATFTPEMEFGELFFTAWGGEEWNLFYTFMFSCMQAYLANNSKILPYESATLERKKLISELGHEFVEYADQLEQDKTLPMADVYDTFIGELSDIQRRRFSKRLFGLNLKRYCEHNGLELERRNQGNIKTYRLNRVSR